MELRHDTIVGAKAASYPNASGLKVGGRGPYTTEYQGLKVPHLTHSTGNR